MDQATPMPCGGRVRERVAEPRYRPIRDYAAIGDCRGARQPRRQHRLVHAPALRCRPGVLPHPRCRARRRLADPAAGRVPRRTPLSGRPASAWSAWPATPRCWSGCHSGRDLTEDIEARGLRKCWREFGFSQELTWCLTEDCSLSISFYAGDRLVHRLLGADAVGGDALDGFRPDIVPFTAPPIA
ncbi:MAG: hypothetical protein K0S35_2565 [Geminicoccaceae bacterium]|nr:hypothetical protein [Geminicoccaceae bacterium]